MKVTITRVPRNRFVFRRGGWVVHRRSGLVLGRVGQHDAGLDHAASGNWSAWAYDPESGDEPTCFDEAVGDLCRTRQDAAWELFDAANFAPWVSRRVCAACAKLVRWCPQPSMPCPDCETPHAAIERAAREQPDREAYRRRVQAAIAIDQEKP